MIPVEVDPAVAAARCWRPGREPRWSLDGATLWCDGCDDGTRCGICVVRFWPDGFRLPGGAAMEGQQLTMTRPPPDDIMTNLWLEFCYLVRKAYIVLNPKLPHKSKRRPDGYWDISPDCVQWIARAAPLRENGVWFWQELDDS